MDSELAQPKVKNVVSSFFARLCPTFVAVVAAVCFCAVVSANASAKSQFRAPGWGELSYEPPAPGTYELPTIKLAVDGEVLTSDNSPSRLFDLMSDRFVLLSFIFTRCTDGNGCPLANAVLHKVQARLNKRSDLADKVSLLTISFDPEFDVPERLATLKDIYSSGPVNWNFLTTKDQQSLQPLLDGYGQFPVRFEHEGAHGEGVVEYIHLLRVYLIDLNKQIRNIYSVAFLHPDILMNDLETLILELPAK